MTPNEEGQTPDKKFAVDPDYTHAELVAYFADPRSNGFTAASCGGCRKKINLASLSHQMGWGCPGCGHYNVGDWSGNHQIPYERPDFGPTRQAILAAVEESRAPETDGRLKPPAHLRTVVITAVEDLRPEGERSPLYRPGMYALAPKDFPSECVLTVSTSGGCYATRTADGTPDMYLTLPARSPEAAALLHYKAEAGSQSAAPSDETSALLGEARQALGSGTEGAPRVLAVYQEPGVYSDDPPSRRTQLAFALAAASELGARVAVILPGGSYHEVPGLTAMAREIDPGVEVVRLDYENARGFAAAPRQVTLVTHGGLGRLLLKDSECPRDAFDVVVVMEGAVGDWEGAASRLAGRFSGARLILLWTARFPFGSVVVVTPAARATLASGGTAEEVLRAAAGDVVGTGRGYKAGAVTVFDAVHVGPAMESLADTPDPLGWRERRQLGRIHELYTLGADRVSVPFSPFTYLGGLPAETFEHPYKEMPPVAELKVATVSSIQSPPFNVNLGGVLRRMEMPADESVREGMYVLVPAHFPARCAVTRTALGCYAEWADAGATHSFRVWPAATVAEAEARYASEGPEAGLVPQAIGSVRRPVLGDDAGLFEVFEVSGGRAVPGAFSASLARLYCMALNDGQEAPRYDVRPAEAGAGDALPEGELGAAVTELDGRLGALCFSLHATQLVPAAKALALLREKLAAGGLTPEMVKTVSFELDMLENEAGRRPKSGNVGMVYFLVHTEDLKDYGDKVMAPATAERLNVEAVGYGWRYMTQADFSRLRRERGLDPLFAQRHGSLSELRRLEGFDQI